MRTSLWSSSLSDRRARAVGRTIVALLATTACASHGRPATSPQPPSRAERELAADLGRIFRAPIMARGLWGVEVRSLETGRSLFELNSRTLLMPASNMKILTLATAAETLGWDYRFSTVLETAAPVEAGVLAGDLIVRGGGDPSINGRNGRAWALFDEWAAALRTAGIFRVDGRVIGEDNAFDDRTLGGGWAWDYLQYGYAAPVGALQFNEDVAQLTLRPGAREGDPLFVELTPGSGLTIINRAITGPPQSEGAIEYERRLDTPTLELTGALAIDAAPLTRDIAVVNPTIYFAQALKNALVARGIEVTGDAIDADLILDAPHPDARRVLVQAQSPPLRDIAGVLMKVSQNLYAESLLKAIGAARGGLGTTEGGRIATRALLTSWGIPEDAYVQVDGSGLSRYNYVTADALVTILEHLYRDPHHREAFVSTLPIAGSDGTISTRLKRTRAEGNATVKTGSIANVRALSGYVRTRDGEMLAFSIIANNFTLPASTVNWIADLAVETLANFTRQ